MRRLVLDNDLFFLLSASGLLDPWLDYIGIPYKDVFVQTSLFHILKKRSGKLCRLHSGELINKAHEDVKKFNPLPVQENELVNAYSEIDDIDNGEAQIFAFVSSCDAIYAGTNDKRSLKALSQRTELSGALKGRVYCLEIIIYQLICKYGWQIVNQKISLMRCVEKRDGGKFDRTLSVLFSERQPSEDETLDGLRSCLRDISSRFGLLLVPLA